MKAEGQFIKQQIPQLVYNGKIVDHAQSIFVIDHQGNI